MKNNSAVMAIELACDELNGFTKAELAERNQLSQAGVSRIRAREDYNEIRDAVLTIYVDEIARTRARETVHGVTEEEVE